MTINETNVFKNVDLKKHHDQLNELMIQLALNTKLLNNIKNKVKLQRLNNIFPIQIF